MQIAGGGGSVAAAQSITVGGQKLTFVVAGAEVAAQCLENVARILVSTLNSRDALESMPSVGGEEVSAMAVVNFRSSAASAGNVIDDTINEIQAAVATLRATSSAYATQDGDL